MEGLVIRVRGRWKFLINILFPLDVQPTPSYHITTVQIIGIVAGTLGTVVIVLLAVYCIARKKRWLSLHSKRSSRTTNQRNPESLPCEPVFTNGECQRQSLCENMQNAAECVQIVKKAPEIGSTMKRAPLGGGGGVGYPVSY